MNNAIASSAIQVCHGVAKKMGFRLIQLNGESDHIHCLIEYPPKLSISQIVNSLKGVSRSLSDLSGR